MHILTQTSCPRWHRCNHEYSLFSSSSNRTAAESLAFLTLGIGSPTHSSVHPLSVVFTRTAKVNLFACAGPPSFTHLDMQNQLLLEILYYTYRQELITEKISSPIKRHGPISTQTDIIQGLSGKCLIAILLLFPIFNFFLGFVHLLLL